MPAVDPDTLTQQLTPVSAWSDESDVDDDYLDSVDSEELPGRPLRKRFGPATGVLLSLALAAIAFFGGVVVEKGKVKSSASSGNSSLAALAARFRSAGAAGGGTGGTGGFAGGSGGAVTGTITLVDGANVYITQSDGTIVKAITSAGSQITVTSAGTVSSLHPGDSVTVTGPANANGDVTATSVRDNGAGGGTGGGGRRSGGTGGAAATGGGATPVPVGGPPGG